MEPEQINDIIKESGGWDNEWVRLMATLSKNEGMKDLVDFLNAVYWSRRQKHVLLAYTRTMLSSRFSTTNFQDHNDYRMFQDDKSQVDCDLTVGLTRFDLTPEWNQGLDMINMQFGANARMSKGGWFVGRIGAQKHEIYQEERGREHMGMKDKLKDRLGLGE